jgi:2-amino-4-hydroxy-6-hydroxymethyldihydropteridine diphosphokinase
MPEAFLGVGSNMGNREENIERAFELLTKSQIEILQNSSIIETDPVGGPPQGKFLNCVIKIRTDLPPLSLLKVLKKIEKQLGRVKTVVDAPRPIDLDILLYDDITCHEPELTIPHPRMRERSFVMMPLKEIAPNVVKDLKLEI